MRDHKIKTCIIVMSLLMAVLSGGRAVQANSISLEVKNSTGNAPFTVSYTASPKLDKGLSIDSFSWDFDGNGKIDLNSGKNPLASYTFLKTGAYNTTVIAKLSNGASVSASVKLTVTAPSSSVAILSPGANQIISGDIPVIIYVNHDKLVLQRIEFWLYDEVTNEVAMVDSQTVTELSKDGKYTFEWPTNTNAQSGHRYYLFARAYDANNFYLGSPSVLVTVKNNPAAQIKYPTDKSTVSGVVPVTVEANEANPSYPLTKIELWATDETANKTEVLQSVAVSNKNPNNNYQIAWDTNQAGKEGHNYYLYVKVYDTVGNSYTSSSIYIKVRNKPSAEITSPANHGIVSGVVPLILNATPASTDYPLKKIELYCGDVKTNQQQLLETRILEGKVIEDKFTFKWNTNTQARNGNRYQLYFTVYDSANNSYTTTPIYLAVNNTPGALVISPQDRFTASGNVEIVVEAYSASPDAAIQRMELYGIDEELNSKRLLETREINPGSTGRQHKFVWQTNTNAYNNHHYYLYAVITDNFGNTSTSNSIYGLVKNIPSGAVVFPVANQRVSGILDVKVEAHPASPDFPIQQIELWSYDVISNIKRKVNQVNGKSANENGVYTLKWDTSLQSQNRVELYAIISDIANNIYTSVPVAVNIDNSPSALLLAPAAGDLLSSQVEVKVEAHSATIQFPLKKIELRAIDQFTNQTIILETIEIKQESSDGKYSILWDTSKVQSGRKYLIYTRVYDIKDNYTNSNDAMVQVNNIPVVNLLNPLDKMSISGNVDIKFIAQPMAKNAVIERTEVWIQDIDSGESKKVIDFSFSRPLPGGLYNLRWDSSKDVSNNKKYYFYLRVYDSLGNYYTTPHIVLFVRK